MKKVLIATALLFTALPFTFDGVTPTVSKADARIGRPLTPLSVAGVHRRVVRRNFGVGANLGYRGFHPVARAAAVGAVGAATGWGGGWGADVAERRTRLGPKSLRHNADIRVGTGACHRPKSIERAPNRIVSNIMIGQSFW